MLTLEEIKIVISLLVLIVILVICFCAMRTVLNRIKELKKEKEGAEREIRLQKFRGKYPPELTPEDKLYWEYIEKCFNKYYKTGYICLTILIIAIFYSQYSLRKDIFVASILLLVITLSFIGYFAIATIFTKKDKENLEDLKKQAEIAEKEKKKNNNSQAE